MIWIFTILIIAFLIKLEMRDRKKSSELWRYTFNEEKGQREECFKKEAFSATTKEEKKRPKVAARYYRQYKEALRRIPRSEWILLTREEKSDIYKKRESLKQDFDNLPWKTQKFIVEKYKIDTRFSESK